MHGRLDHQGDRARPFLDAPIVHAAVEEVAFGRSLFETIIMAGGS
jgi:hypothetical protein